MFGPLDWSIVVAYIVGTTLVGHHLKGKQHTTRDFFLGGRSMPWYAVTASTIATTISAVTFIGVPALVYAAGGDYVYLQLAMGGFIARYLVARFLVPLYYEKEFYSPYEYMEDRLGPIVGRITAGMFFLGGILGQGVRVYATALVLELVTGWSLYQSIVLIAVFSILWTWMGGIAAVIWTDFVQFFILIAGGIAALFFVTDALPNQWATMFEIGREAGKFQVFDFSTDPRIAFTFWAALIAMPFQNVAVYGTDHLFVQRLLCCRNEKEARKAVLWSNVGELVPALMLTVGAGLFAFYEFHDLSPELAALVAERGDRIFPAFIISEIPTGLKGLLIAGILSAAISSLDSILAALSQISLTMFYRPFIRPQADETHLLRVSRLFVIFWGAVLAVMAWQFSASKLDIVTLAFSMTTYTWGPMLGLFILSILSTRYRVAGAGNAVMASIVVVFFINEPEILNPLFGTLFAGPLLAWPWLFPIGALLCVTLSLRGRKTELPE
ncbi:MAG: sodium:solute symporter [Pseudomonadota bacterium]|nr:sodium:solute symporter [Pseudomonadota bacterium]